MDSTTLRNEDDSPVVDNKAALLDGEGSQNSTESPPQTERVHVDTSEDEEKVPLKLSDEGKPPTHSASPPSYANPPRRRSSQPTPPLTRHWSNDANATETLSVWCGTWNLGNAPPPESAGLMPFINPEDGYDIYVVGTQETSYQARSQYQKKSVLGAVHEKVGNYIDFGQDWAGKHPNVADWIATMRGHMGHNYYLVVEKSLWAIRILVFALKTHRGTITDIETTSIACGVANMLGNKGAVAVSFRYKKTSLCFLSAHLAAHQDMTSRRNEDFKEIVSEMQIGNKEMDILTQFHHLFWLGDLNYRVAYGSQGDERTPAPQLFETMVNAVMERNFDDLLKHDQLKKEIDLGKAFLNFHEGDINFPPTFKVAVDQVLEFNPKRSPAWCDRILWHSVPGLSANQEFYKSALAVLSSDHKPVYSVFNVPCIPSEPKQPDDPWVHNYGIRFRNLRARGLIPWDAATQTCDPYLKVPKSFYVENTTQTPYVAGSINPSWPQGLFVRLSNEIQCNKTLGNALVMIAVMDHDLIPPHTLLGRAIIPVSVLGPLYLSGPLVPLDKTEPILSEFVGFEAPITLGGELRGHISGELRVEGVLRQDPPPGVSRAKSQPTKAESVVNFGFNFGLAALSKAKKVPGAVTSVFSKKSR